MQKAGAQSINNLTVQQTLIAMKQLLAPQGVQFDNASMCIKRNGNKVVIGNGDYELGFSNDGEVSILCLGKPVLTFSALSGSGVVTYENVTVKESLKTKKLYIGGIDIEDKVTPLGVVQMWAGKVEKYLRTICFAMARSLTSSHTKTCTMSLATHSTMP